MPTPSKAPAAHTPGPWMITETTGSELIIAKGPYGENWHELARVGDSNFKANVVHEKTWANAHLIASAPELLAALEDLTELAQAMRDTINTTPALAHLHSARSPRIDRAIAVAAKTKGRTS